MPTSFDDYADRRKARWTAGQRAAYEVAEQSFADERARHLAIGADLAARRTELKLSQPRLAELSGVHQSEISRIETGQANPTMHTVERLSRALGLQIAFIAADDPEPEHAATR